MLAGLRRVARGESNIDFVGRSRLWAALTLVVIGTSLGGLLGRGLNLGLEFRGGTAFSAPLRRSTTVAAVHDALARFPIGDPEVQIATAPGGGRELRVRSEQIADRATLAAVQAEIARLAGQTRPDGTPDPDAVSVTDVGPTWGRQVSSKALRGLVIFLVLVSAYIAWRFEPAMAVGALVALFHDLIATAGIYALVGFEVTPATVIALLTLMGFSLYDTVVVFDRVRENAEAAGGGRVSYAELVNRSVNQVLMRSINTSLSSVLPVAGLLFVGVLLLGAETLQDLALAMFVGTFVSTYSSIVVATPILAWLKRRRPGARPARARREVARPEPAGAGASAEPAGGPRPTPRPVAVGARTPPRPRRRRRGKRRR
jgi:preprotein translocase subunit SecF